MQVSNYDSPKIPGRTDMKKVLTRITDPKRLTVNNLEKRIRSYLSKNGQFEGLLEGFRRTFDIRDLYFTDFGRTGW